MAQELDYLIHKHPELDDLLADYASTKEIGTRYEEMLARGQILSLDQLHYLIIYKLQTLASKYNIDICGSTWHDTV